MILAWSRFKTPGNKTPKGVRVLKKRRRSARSLTLFFLRNFMANRPQLLQSPLSASAMCFASVTAFFITNCISFRINSHSLFWFFFLLNYNAFLLTTTRFVAASKYFAFFVAFFVVVFYNTFQARTIFHSTKSYLWSCSPFGFIILTVFVCLIYIAIIRRSFPQYPPPSATQDKEFAGPPHAIALQVTSSSAPPPLPSPPPSVYEDIQELPLIKTLDVPHCTLFQTFYSMFSFFLSFCISYSRP